MLTRADLGIKVLVLLLGALDFIFDKQYIFIVYYIPIMNVLYLKERWRGKK